MTSANGCCGQTNRVDGLADLIGSLPIATTDPEPDERYSAVTHTCTPSFFRERGADILDLVMIGKTIGVTLDLAPGAPALAVVLPWAVYAELATMRETIRGLGAPRGPSGFTAQSGQSRR